MMKVPLKAIALKTVHKNYTGRRLGDGLNYANHITRNNKELTLEITNKVGRGVTEAEGWVKLQDVVDKSLDRVSSRTEGIQHLEEAGIEEKVCEAAAKEMEAFGTVQKKPWITRVDDRVVRDTHEYLHGMTIGIDDNFETTNGSAMEPCMFGLPEEENNCRCQSDFILAELMVMHTDDVAEIGEFKAWASTTGYII